MIECDENKTKMKKKLRKFKNTNMLIYIPVLCIYFKILYKCGEALVLYSSLILA